MSISIGYLISENIDANVLYFQVPQKNYYVYAILLTLPSVVCYEQQT